MIKITINKKKYKGVYRWEDITLHQFCALAAIPMPEGYEAYILADGKFDHNQQDSVDYYTEVVLSLTDKQLNEDFPEYFKKVFACLSNVPESVLAIIPNDMIEDKYNKYFKPFVLSLIYNNPVIYFMGQIKVYEPDLIERIKIGFKTFYLPKVINVMGQDIPLKNEPVITYSEATDIFRGIKIIKDDAKRLALFMGIYCRKRNERYSEEKALRRQELFMKVRMSVIWSVFFYTIQRLPDYTKIMQLFGRLPHLIREEKAREATYHGLAIGA